MKPLLPLLALMALMTSATAADAPPQQPWSFDGVFGTYDRGAVQRGFQVYKEVCATCHSLNLVAFHDLGGLGFSEVQVKSIAAGYKIAAEPDLRGEIFDDKGNRLTRPGVPSDRLTPPFDNEAAARAANNGALPPDLSLIVKARPGGADYVYALLTGFDRKPPPGFALLGGKYYNPYFAGGAIAMPPPLNPDSVAFSDGTPASVANEAKAVAAFLAWTSDPNLEARHRIGFQVMAFLVLLAGLMALSYRKLWYGRKKDSPETGDPDTLSGG